MGFLGDIGKGFEKLGDTMLRTIPGIGDKISTDEANKENRKIAETANAWQERMSNSAYQRAMEDMKKAGLNPMLAYQQGGASVPTPHVPTMSAANATGLSKAAIGAFTGIQTANATAQNAQTAKSQSQSTISLQSAQAAQTIAQTENTQAQTAKTLDSIKNQKTRRELEQAQIPLQKVKESAASLAQKGVSTLDKLSNNVLKNTAKPSVDKKTLEYKNPLNPKNWFKKD